MEEQLQRILDAHCLPCGAVIAPAGNVVALAGDFDSFSSAGLVSAMLGPYGSAEATYHTVQDPHQIKPMIWCQGSQVGQAVPAGITLATSKTKSVNQTLMMSTLQMDCSNRSRQAQPDLLVDLSLNVRFWQNGRNGP